MLSLSSPLLASRAVIRSIVPMAVDNHLFELAIDPSESNGVDLSSCRPGQFFELWIPGVGEAPISVCSGRAGNTIQLLVRRVGRVTSALFQMKEGDWLGLRGPYGTGFPVDFYKGKDLVLIAGGLGIAPIRSVWEYVLDHREDYGELVLIYGMRHSNELLFRQEMRILLRRDDIDVYIAAEDIIGPQLPPEVVQLGRVTDMIRMAKIESNFQAALCGPPVMYKYAIDELSKKGVPSGNIWLSLERHMKCGIGKCGHCFVGGAFTCKSGPVFNMNALRVLPEAIECGYAS